MGKKSVNNLYKPMLEHSNVEKKFHKAAKGKTERPDVAVILEPTNIQRHVKSRCSGSITQRKRPEREKGDHSISWDSSSITTRRFCGKASC